MYRQKSYENNQNILYLVPTPIGNLEDMTLRALNCLKNCDIILAEDTRNTRKLCTHFEITAQLVSLHEHNEGARVEYVASLLVEGKKVALVSDAGMPAISDPGQYLVNALRRQGFAVSALPGANAFVTAFAGSGVLAKNFFYYGFLSAKSSKRRKELVTLLNIESPIIFYESVHRIKDMLEDVATVFGEADVTLVREISKLHEEYIFGSVQELIANVDGLKGEFVVIVEPKMKEAIIDETICEQYKRLKSETTLPDKEIMKDIAKQRKLRKNEVYKAILDCE